MKREHRYGYRHSAGPLGDGHLEERHSIGLLSGAVDALVVWTHVQFLLRFSVLRVARLDSVEFPFGKGSALLSTVGPFYW